MEFNDTVKLLRECDAGTKMAVQSLDDAMTKTHNEAKRRSDRFTKWKS